MFDLGLVQQKGADFGGADPAEGNPTSDDSALTILERDSGEEVASLASKVQHSLKLSV